MKAFSPFALALLLSAVPAFAGVTVSSPLNSTTVSSPFQLIATASPCSSQSISAMGYSLDSSSSTVIVKSTSISASVSATIGSHILHVKSWGTLGASCTTSVSITVVQPTTTNLKVTSPLNGASVASPFILAASATLCSSKPVTSVGYSLDSSTSTTEVNGTALTTKISAAAGAHTLHVKAWGAGVSCAANIAVTVTAPITISSPNIPSDAVAIKAIQNLSIWRATYDTGTGGSGASATGAMQLVSSPSISGSARQFVTTYTSYGGERYNVKVGTDAVSTNFVYDTRIYLASPSSDIANIEMDLNQVMSNGQTVIFGFQCDGWSNTWDYTENAGTPTSPSDKWVHSNQTCSPRNWSTNAWHHVQISYSRDSSGNITYNGVWLDGVEQSLNVTVPSAFALGWAPSLNINFQIDGMTSTSGAATVYLDDTTLYSW